MKIIIQKNGLILLVKSYTFLDAYYINRWLREIDPYEYYHPFLEHKYKDMLDVCRSAPPLDKNYVVYRFILDEEASGQAADLRYNCGQFVK